MCTYNKLFFEESYYSKENNFIFRSAKRTAT